MTTTSEGGSSHSGKGHPFHLHLNLYELSEEEIYFALATINEQLNLKLYSQIYWMTLKSFV